MLPHAIKIYQTGAPETMCFEEVPVVEPGAGEVDLYSELCHPLI
jgi:NADPH:quinone reductase-like Zn-dependent oxidoreductase